jgi:regulator of RNase E activity RraA
MIEEPPILRITRNFRRPSEDQIAAFQGVPTGFVVDALQGTGAMEADIGPLGEGRDIDCVASGPALTADCGPADVLALLAAQVFVQRGDMVVSAVGGHRGCAAAGDRVAGMLKNGGAAGLVTDGPVRDYSGIVEVGLPVWCTGLTPATPFSKGPGKVGYPIQIGGQQVATGDMVVADRDGVVVVPFAQIDAVIAALPRIRELETTLDEAVANGSRVPGWVEDLLESSAVSFQD